MSADGVLCITARNAYCDNFPEGDRFREVSAQSVPVHAGVLSAQGCESGLREPASAVSLGSRWLLDPGKAAAAACVVVDPKYLIIMETRGSYPPAWTVARPRSQPAGCWLLDSEPLFHKAPKPRLRPFRDALRLGILAPDPDYSDAGNFGEHARGFQIFFASHPSILLADMVGEAAR